MSSSNYIEIEVEEIKAATDKALLCVIDGEETWLPRSQVDGGENFENGEKNVSMYITQFIAREKGLE
jgi:hypothetical protein